MEALPEVRTSVVATFRSKYSCECKAYISSGWICSHELVAAAINRHLNLAEVQAGIPHRQRENAVYAGPRGRLRRHLAQYPTEAVECKALHHFLTSSSEAPAETHGSCYTGCVTSGQLEADPIKWTISFSDGQTHDVILDELIADLTMATSRHI
ncbi:hypothetical protein L916_10642 [Phytophthora nicotianae]|uniref:SWIM-type domain-containing protein n=1 Tax=Phytophthora nicotianae TaxID=4792 RepID=W2IW04_PHYNI|nr:hypothetical protein L916_10642 [Phytophthora nicotianae]